MHKEANTRIKRLAARRLLPLTEWAYSDVGAQFRRVAGAGNIVLGCLGILSIAALRGTHSEYVWPLALITLTTCGGLQLWRAAGGLSAPFFPILLVQQGVIYGLPLAVRNPTIREYSSQTVLWSSEIVAIAMVAACVGWSLARLSPASSPSRLNIRIAGTTNGMKRSLVAAQICLSLGVMCNVLILSDLLWTALGSQAAGLFPIIHTIVATMDLVAAMLGGFAVAALGKSHPIRRLFFWLALFAEVLLTMRELMVSGSMFLVAGATVGLWIGGRRVPWVFLLSSLTLVASLNYGKTTMRQRYWVDGTITGVGLVELPSFYLEWVGESRHLLREDRVNRFAVGATENTEGQSLFWRLDSLQNILFIVNALDTGAEPLHGATYKLIPVLLIPRIFWPDKPRTHAGQIMLNLAFGRQTTDEETERTYIAWGLLPEAVGNFGPTGGALCFGLVSGLICGLVEVWSAKKRLFSIEGSIVGALLIQEVVSFEWAASVAVTSTFQLLCIVVPAGLAFYFWQPDGPRQSGKLKSEDRNANRVKPERLHAGPGNAEILKEWKAKREGQKQKVENRSET